MKDEPIIFPILRVALTTGALVFASIAAGAASITCLAVSWTFYLMLQEIKDYK